MSTSSKLIKSVKLSERNRRNSCGFPAPHPPAAQGTGDRAKELGGGGPGDRVLHFPTADREEGATSARADRHLRQDGDLLAASCREVSHAGRSHPRGRPEEKAGGPPLALVQGSTGVDSSQVRFRKHAAHPCDVREGALWRPRTPRHPEAAGRCQASDETGVER